MSILRQIYYRLSPDLRMLSRRIFYFPIDFWDFILKKRLKYQPPKGDIYIGSGDFIAQGRHHLELLRKYIDLNPEDHILDIGCGIGRSAVALTTFISSKGKYEGFDVVEKGIKWCNQNIASDFENFTFRYVSLHNDLYNSNVLKANKFDFSYEDNSFDKVFLFSVFTHMSIEGIERYLCEIRRVLKPRGKCLSTFFIYQTEEEQMTQQGDFVFPFKKEGYRLMNDRVKSANIAISMTLLREIIGRADLKIEQMIEGYWKNGIDRDPTNDFQDILVIAKR